MSNQKDPTMATSSPNPSTADLVDGTLGLAAGVGIVTMALFPLAIPILALTAVALTPLLLIPPRRGIDRGAVPAVVPPSGCPRSRVAPRLLDDLRTCPKLCRFLA